MQLNRPATRASIQLRRHNRLNRLRYGRRGRERRPEHDRRDSVIVTDHPNANASALTVAGGRPHPGKRWSARRSCSRGGQSVGPEHAGRELVVRSEGTADGGAKSRPGVLRSCGLLNRRSRNRVGCACAARQRLLRGWVAAVAGAAAAAGKQQRGCDDHGGSSHAAASKPALASSVAKRGRTPSQRSCVPVPSKSGFSVGRFPSIPTTSTISSTCRGRKSRSPCL
jgi:hypothetical protein